MQATHRKEIDTVVAGPAHLFETARGTDPGHHREVPDLTGEEIEEIIGRKRMVHRNHRDPAALKTTWKWTWMVTKTTLKPLCGEVWDSPDLGAPKTRKYLEMMYTGCGRKRRYSTDST